MDAAILKLREESDGKSFVIGYSGVTQPLLLRDDQESARDIRFFMRIKSVFHKEAKAFLKRLGHGRKDKWVCAISWERPFESWGESMAKTCEDDEDPSTCTEAPASEEAQRWPELVNDMLKDRAGFLGCDHLILASTTATPSEVEYWMERIPKLARFSPRAACHPRCSAWKADSDLGIAFRAGVLDLAIAARADMFVTSYGSDEAQIVMEERVFGKKSKETTFNELSEHHNHNEL